MLSIALSGGTPILEEITIIRNSINDAIQPVAEMKTVLTYMKSIGLLAIIILLFKSFFYAISAGEQIKIKEDIIKPLSYTLLLLLWGSILNLITILSKDVGDFILDMNTNAANIDFATKAEKLIEFQKAKLNVTSFFSLQANITTYFSALILEGCIAFGTYLDRMFLILFAAYAEIMLIILKIVSPIALVITFFKGLNSTIINWIKSFISVNLWFGIAALIFRLVNALSLSYLEYYITSDSYTTQFTDLFIGLFLGLIFIGFGIFKGILMFKVPNIVSMFIGTSPSSGMFAAAFAPLAVGAAAIKTGISAGKSLAKGGFKSK